jgi:orotidine-5'-phosphate decarboxylase
MNERERTSAGGRERLIVALDLPGRAEALALVDRLGDAALWYKVGLELFIAEGRSMVEALRAQGRHVFLDLKLHDIPETVARAVEGAARLGADLLTVHAAGGAEMLRRAVAAAGETGVLAVTVLTSLDLRDLADDGSRSGSVEELVLLRAARAAEAGCAGVVCSPREAAAIRRLYPPPFRIVTPGVRRGTASDDQKRVESPAAARAAGADQVVVGRPIRDAVDPRTEALAIAHELE